MPGKIHDTAHISACSSIKGLVHINEHCFVAFNAKMIGGSDEENHIHIGKGTNIQDGVIIYCPENGTDDQANKYLINISSHCSIAHGAQIGGRTTIHKKSFVGFRAVIKDSIIGRNCFIDHMATVIGVTLPPNTYVPIGAKITSQAAVDLLMKVTDDKLQFNKYVVDFNKGVIDSHKNHTDYAKSNINDSAKVSQEASIFGDITIANNSIINKFCSIRADEGSPFYIGKEVIIDSGVIMHGLGNQYKTVCKKEWSIFVDDYCQILSDTVFHGPAVIERNSTVGKESVILDATIGNNSIIGNNCGIFGVTLLPNSFVPNGLIVTTQEMADRLQGVRLHKSTDRSALLRS